MATRDYLQDNDKHVVTIYIRRIVGNFEISFSAQGLKKGKKTYLRVIVGVVVLTK